MEKNKVIIIGNDHTNTLGVIRTFGENGIKPYVIIVSNTKMVAVIKSKYVEKYWICTDENIALLTVMTEFSEEKLKPVIIPTSDSVALKIDESYNKLSKKFIVPSINDKQGEIVKYMDKFNQYELVTENNINMAKSIIVDLDNDKEYKSSYPCILKPIVSAVGKKEDITICNTKEEMITALDNLKKLKYKKILLQEFIKYDYELDIGGYSYNGKTCISGAIKKIRIWPEKTGSTTYGLVIPPKKIKKIITDIEKLMKKINYNGIFDIDYFINNDASYLNEINFRNGALSYAYGDSYLCYYWYLSNINKEFTQCPMIQEEYKFIDDQADLHNIFDRKISIKEFLKDKKECKYMLEKNRYDKKPSRCIFIYKILKKLD